MTLVPHIIVPSGKIQDFCQKWGIQEFALFGSVLRDDFHKDSDIDVLVTFAEDIRYSLFDLVRMQQELEHIFERDVDLVDRLAVEESLNYIRRQEVMSTMQVIYAA